MLRVVFECRSSLLERHLKVKEAVSVLKFLDLYRSRSDDGGLKAAFVHCVLDLLGCQEFLDGIGHLGPRGRECRLEVHRL